MTVRCLRLRAHRLAFGLKQLERPAASAKPYINVYSSMAIPAGIYFRSEKYETSTFFLKMFSTCLWSIYRYLELVYYVPIALLLVVTLVIYLKQVRSKQF